MDRTQELIAKAQQAKECRGYLTDIVKRVREDLYKMLAESPDKAVEAHYIYLALNKLYAKMQEDINVGVRGVKKAEKG
jgi:hypothetical protein